MRVEYECPICGERVSKNRTPGNLKVPPKYCSQKCNGAAKRLNKKGPTPNTFYRCLNCGKEVATYRSPSAKQAFESKFCSLTCAGEYQSGDGNPAWAGGRHLQNGYMVVFAPDHPRADCKGFVYEHRLVAEQKANRHLKPEEVVHHIDGDKRNNDPGNLMIFASNSEHLKHHARGRKRERA